jgi:hypothetical protein
MWTREEAINTMITRVVFTDVAGTFAGAIVVGSDFFNEWIESADPDRFFSEGGTVHVEVNDAKVGSPVKTLAALRQTLEGVAA